MYLTAEVAVEERQLLIALTAILLERRLYNVVQSSKIWKKGWLKMRVRILLGMVALTLTSGSLCAATTDRTKRTDCQLEGDPSKSCLFSTDEANYEIGSKGRVLMSITGASDKSAQLPFDGLVLDTVFYMPYEHDLILLCEVEDGESAAGLIFRLNPDLTVKWRLKFPAFNLSIGALEGHFLYQAGIGTVAKVDLERGVYAWKHENLYDQKLHSFNSFRKPEIGPDEVIFQEEPVPNLRGPAHSIRVNKLTGKMQTEWELLATAKSFDGGKPLFLFHFPMPDKRRYRKLEIEAIPRWREGDITGVGFCEHFPMAENSPSWLLVAIHFEFWYK
jgi:hypothetical protein